jgi:guanylate kinase
MSKKGKLVVISAPSGAGKGTVIKCLLELRPEMAFSVSATTRAPRTGETDGVSYYFVTHDKFREMIDSGKFLEYAEYVGEFYGTPKAPIDECVEKGITVLLDIEIQGAKQVTERVPEAVTIFIVPPDMEELERRLRGRGTDSEEKLVARLKKARLELEEKSRYDHVVVNDEVLRAAEEILSIIDGVYPESVKNDSSSRA